MWRNREIRVLFVTMFLITLVGLIVAALLSLAAVLIVIMVCSLLIGCTLIFTKWRYHEIEKLSSYLRIIASGNYSLDLRDNYEGELSILKNDIYKVTQMLSGQQSLLRQDKIHLMNAISDISHQLKTPLTSLMVMADLLSDANLPAEKRIEFTHNIHVQLERTEWLVSSLLKLSKIDAGTVQFKQDRIVVKALIEKSLVPFLIPMDVKEQTVLIEGDESISFLGDLNWTAEALINILKNSVEHTDEGGEIRIYFSDNILFTEILIIDNGKGIPREDIAHIFKRFYKGKNANEESVGIGLAMAFTIITSQSGDIEVKSVEGKGTEFRIKFYK